jgi:hypothetical protein
MSKKLHLRKLPRNKLHKGRFKYVLCLKRSHWCIRNAVGNRKDIVGIREWLKSACHGHYLVESQKNRKKEVVYTKIYLCRPMDVAMIKLTHSDVLWRIYEIIPAESPSLSE